MQQLPSGTRFGSPWPIAAFNTLGGLARRAGLFPRLSDPAMLEPITRKLGIEDGANAWLKEARRVRFKSFDEEAGLTLFGALAVRAQIRQCYANTLRFERLIAAHPEIAAEKIERPLFVIGWPRTGTTLVQRLLSLHKDARYIPVWEGYTPLPDEGERAGAPTGRTRRAARALALLDWLAPEMKSIHPLGPDAPDECYHLFRNYCAMPAGWDFAYLPSYWAWFEAEGAEPAYRLHKRQLQILQWLNRRGHWVLKSPQHLAGLPALLQVYPDARIVCTHRDPCEVVASYCSLLAVAWGMTSDVIDRDRIACYVLETTAKSQTRADPVLRDLPRDHVFHVQFRELVRDPVSMIAAAYRQLGYPRDDGLRARSYAWIAANPADRLGTHRYDLADFGLTKTKVLSALGEPAPSQRRLAGA